MAEDNKPVQPPSGGASGNKPESSWKTDFFSYKEASLKREKKLKEELAESKQRGAELEAELKIAKTDTEDEGEISEVKKALLKRDAELNEKDRKLAKDLASIEEREKEVRVKTLASEYQVEIDAIKDAEDPEKEALRIVAKRLTKEKEETPAPESVFESKTPGGVKVPIKDMPDTEFDAVWEKQKREALSKK